MILFFYIMLNVIGIFLFQKIKKQLHILEIIVYWLVASYFFQNFSALCYMNFKTIQIPEKLSYEFSHFLNRILLYPMIMVSFLNFILILNTLLKKLLLIIIYVCALTGLEWLSDSLGVINHVHWQMWWSFSLWFVFLLVLIVIMKFFRIVLFKKRVYG
ncbi:hypothetical protein RCG23_00680 [Neobacillus sp. PS3-34]|uniref:hypothetical protein n=1 Tax=Neobacillus sp. PS3-34 TaxID=3070678 RepID=UPI0027DF3D60|nr:hypothetical protein [Neobacillus sp. PS3-34]WML48700.1 hypothetical protein RCG23_00680 [Neobacillus sp. PS3-34]